MPNCKWCGRPAGITSDEHEACKPMTLGAPPPLGGAAPSEAKLTLSPEEMREIAKYFRPIAMEAADRAGHRAGLSTVLYLLLLGVLLLLLRLLFSLA